MSTHVVIGAGCGDEGKGVVTEYLCSRSPGHTAVVRFSGGHQCGHKVVKDGVEHVFSNFGSGTLSGCPTYWSKHCTFEPVGFWKEYSLLREKGVAPMIWVNPACPVTTIYDVFVNRHSVEVKHGTTGTGFFRTKKRHLQDGVGFTAGECLLGSWDLVMAKMGSISDYYDIEDSLDIGSFVEACFEIRRLLHGFVHVTDCLPRCSDLVFEGSQGLLLDEHIGDFPHVTPSDVTPRNALEMAGRVDEVYLVTRAYQTRHGNGPMTNEDLPLYPVNNEEETNEFNEHQGEFRVAVLDLDRLLYAKVEGIDKVVPSSIRTNLVVTCTDQVNPYRVTVDGRVVAFDDAHEFARFLGRSLRINGDLYINTSPCSTTVKQVRLEAARKKTNGKRQTTPPAR